MKLYQNLNVHEKCIVIYQDADLEKKTPKGDGKKVVSNSVVQLIFVANSDGSHFLSLIMAVAIFCP
jgi:hypothetical protein